MTAQCDTVHRVSPHQAERERDRDMEREGEKVVREKFCVCVCARISLLECMFAQLNYG